MKDLDLQYLCTTIGNLTGIPIRIFREKQLLFYHSLVTLPKDPVYVYLDEILSVKGHVGYYFTKHFNYYGIVSSGNIRIVLGPTRQVIGHDQELRELAFRADVPADDVDDFVNAMKEIVPMPLESILETLCTFNYILNDEKLKLKDITIYDTEQAELQNLLEQQRANQNLSRSFNEETASKEFHNSISQEQILTDIVRKGDTAALRKWIASAPAIRGGTLASEQLRQMKNTLIVSATLVSRAAMRGGMSAEDALSLSDAYIQRSELLNTPQQIMNLQYHMVLEYTERVEQIRIGKHPSHLALEVSNYVHHHLSETINTEDIAKELFISRPYLSKKFKEETGDNLTDFILKEKTEEAKRLLRYTDKSATMIGSYLGFSSPSHFSRVFKKYTGKTPVEYRNKYE